MRRRRHLIRGKWRQNDRSSISNGGSVGSWKGNKGFSSCVLLTTILLVLG